MKNKIIKKQEENEDEVIELEQEPKNIVESQDNNLNFKPDSDFTNNANNSLEYASIVSRESETKKNFNEIPKEIRYAFLNTTESTEIQYKIDKYQDLKYLQKKP